MSVLVSTECGFVISHQEYIQRVYSHVRAEAHVYKCLYRPEMFRINTSFKMQLEAQKEAENEDEGENTKIRKRKRVCDESSAITQRVQEQAKVLIAAAQEAGYLCHAVNIGDISDNNSAARAISDNLCKIAAEIPSAISFHGANGTPEALVEKFGSDNFIFPQYCRFFCDDVFKMGNKASELGTFDLIVIDPPWWNKYIRRKRSHDRIDGYKMLSSDDLAKVPISQFLSPGALVAIWCTNSESILTDLKHKLMPAWGVKHVSSWCWLKVTNSGEPTCPYTKPPGKQPYEQLLFGVRLNSGEEDRAQPCPDDGLLLVSVPSAVHSHKPPLLDVLKKYLPLEPRCLEIFARSLLPNCTSWGLEVIKLQHESLFIKEQLETISTSEKLPEGGTELQKVSNVQKELRKYSVKKMLMSHC